MHRDILILGGIAFCFMASQFCFFTYLILFLTQEMKYPIVKAGQYFVSLKYRLVNILSVSLHRNDVIGSIITISVIIAKGKFFPCANISLTYKSVAAYASSVNSNTLSKRLTTREKGHLKEVSK